MITLDPEFVGSMAPPAKLTTDINGKSDTPFARLPRQHRLVLQGRADETEEVSEREDGGEGNAGKVKWDEKRRMRGKNKAMKRYLRKQRKNVIDPKAVRISSIHPFIPPTQHFPRRLHSERSCRKRGTNGRKSEMQRKAYRKTDYQVLSTVSGPRSTEPLEY